MAFSEQLEKIPPSLIRLFFELTIGVKDIINLGIGEPDFNTPQHIKEYVVEGLRRGYTKYGPNQGLPMLREAIAEKLRRDNGIDADPGREIIVTVGANMPIFMSLATFLRDGEEVLIPEPAFVSYAPAVILAGGKPVMIPTSMEDEFKPRIDVLEKYVSRKTRAVIINTPNNPTGTVLTRRDLEEIADFAIEYDLLIISDEIYEYLVYDGFKHVSIASLNGLFDRTITINGFSKAFAMTGWRIGFVVAPQWVIDKMVKIHMYTVTSAVTFIQYAVAKALRDKRTWDSVEYMRREYMRRRDYVWKRLNEIGLYTFKPRGAFYIFPTIKDLGLKSMDFAKKLLEEEKVAVVPGIAFGKSGEYHVRISYAASIDMLEKALDRIEEFIHKLKH
jgi:aminotransferase